MTTIYKVCKRTIEREKAKGALTPSFISDMQAKLDIFSAGNKITAAEYAELSAVLTNEQ